MPRNLVDQSARRKCKKKRRWQPFPSNMSESDSASGPNADSLLPQQGRVEAVLFLAKETLNARKIADLAGLEDATQARTAVKALNEFYDNRQRAFHVKKAAGGYLLMTRPAFAKWIRRLEHVPKHSRLSTPGQETLAVVAYRQPITKAEVENIRGVSCGEILRQLMDRDLVRICGRSEDLGRPFLYATTKEFLKLFGLGSLNELPQAGSLRRSATGSTPPTG